MKIKNFEDYEIDEYGNVYRNKNKLKPQVHNKGYLRVYLSKNGKVSKKYIHRLVAETFIPNPNNLPQVNHIDGNKKNNNVNNLEWVTSKENIIHAFKTGLSVIPKGENNHLYGKRGDKTPYHKAVIQYDLQNNFIKKWSSMIEAERNLKIRTSGICSCCRGKSKKSGGYIWKYAEEI